MVRAVGKSDADPFKLAASSRAVHSAMACGGFEGAPGFDASLAAMVRAVGKK